MFEIVLDLEDGAVLDIATMKTKVHDIAAGIKDPKDEKQFEKAKNELKKMSLLELKK
jgi:hypothetical protein